ncbi:hypothetical protein DYI42_18465 [Vannielia litorea]|nr:hypothetical protein [Vannielia litorea]
MKSGDAREEVSIAADIRSPREEDGCLNSDPFREERGDGAWEEEWRHPYFSGCPGRRTGCPKLN